MVGTGVNFIDMTGAEMIEQESDRLQQKGGGLYFAELKPKVNNFIHRGHFDEHIGAQYFFEKKKHAINKITTVALDHVRASSFKISLTNTLRSISYTYCLTP